MLALMVVVMAGHGVLVCSVLLLGTGGSGRRFVRWRCGSEALGAGDKALDTGEFKIGPH